MSAYPKAWYPNLRLLGLSRVDAVGTDVMTACQGDLASAHAVDEWKSEATTSRRSTCHAGSANKAADSLPYDLCALPVAGGKVSFTSLGNMLCGFGGRLIRYLRCSLFAGM